MLNKRAAAMIATWLVAASAHAVQPVAASRGSADDVIDVAFKSISVMAFLSEVVPPGYKVSYERPDLATRTISSHGRGAWHRLLPYTGAKSGVAMRADLLNKTVYVTAAEIPVGRSETQTSRATAPAQDPRGASLPRRAATATEVAPPVLAAQQNPQKEVTAEPTIATPPSKAEQAPIMSSLPQLAAVQAQAGASAAAQIKHTAAPAPANVRPAAPPPAPHVQPAQPAPQAQRAVVSEPAQVRTPTPAPAAAQATAQVPAQVPAQAVTQPPRTVALQEPAQPRQTMPVAAAPAVTEPVVKVSALAPKKPVWKIRKGEPIHEALADWAEKSDWTLIWYPSVSWKAIGDVVMSEQPDVVAAVSEVVTILRAEGKPIQLRVSDGNNVMEVLATEVKND